MVVSCTNTLSDFFGFVIYVDEFFLNDTLVTASGDPSSVNCTSRGQRPRTFALPTIALGNDGFKIACGSSGGDRITQVIFQISLRLFNGEDLQVACDKSRLIMDGRAYHVESRADMVPNGLLKAASFSYRDVPNREYFCAFNGVGCYPDGNMFGAADTRRSGSVMLHNPNE